MGLRGLSAEDFFPLTVNHLILGHTDRQDVDQEIETDQYTCAGKYVDELLRVW